MLMLKTDLLEAGPCASYLFYVLFKLLLYCQTGLSCRSCWYFGLPVQNFWSTVILIQTVIILLKACGLHALLWLSFLYVLSNHFFQILSRRFFARQSCACSGFLFHLAIIINEYTKLEYLVLEH